MKREDRMIRVSRAWMEALIDRTKRVKKQMDDCPAEDFLVFSKTDISALVGYASSAEAILRLRDKEEDAKNPEGFF